MHPPDGRADAARGSDIQRSIVDPEGRRWLVREVDPPAYDRRSGRSLIFERPEAVRRVRSFPADWHTLSDEALYTLCLTP